MERSLSALSASGSTPANVGHMGWRDASWVMLADVVGTSILTFSFVAAQLGSVITVVLMVACCAFAVYTALLMCRTHAILRRKGIYATSMGEAARHTLGGDASAMFVFAIVYGYAFLGNSTYVLVLGQALQGVLYNFELCLPQAVAVSAVCCWPFVCVVRNLQESTTLCFVNLIVLVGVVVLVLGSLVLQGRSPGVHAPIVADHLTFSSFFGASTNVLYGYAGHWLYFELMTEMEKPEEFMKVFGINAPVQLAAYILTSMLAYYYVGSAAQSSGLLFAMPQSVWFSVASFLLFAHVIVVFLIKTVVLTRFAVSHFSPGSEKSSELRDRLIYAGWATVVLVVGSLAALAIPFFSQFLGLIGGLFAAPISYLFPVLFYCGAVGRTTPEQEDAWSMPMTSMDGAVDDISADQFVWGNVRRISRIARFGFLLILAVVALVAVAGTISEIRSIIKAVGTEGAPLSCQLLHPG